MNLPKLVRLDSEESCAYWRFIWQTVSQIPEWLPTWVGEERLYEAKVNADRCRDYLRILDMKD